MANPAPEPSTFRKLASALSLVLTAGVVGMEALGHFRTEWVLAAFSGVLGLAAVGLTRRSIVLQVLSRGAAWIVLCPALIAVFFQLAQPSRSHFGIEILLTLSTGLALWLAHPMLRTAEARKSFNPKVYRGLFLAGSTASVSAACLAGGIALEAVRPHELGVAAGFGALAISLLASAIGVVRMRGWGIFLGALTSAALMVTSLGMRHDTELSIALMLFTAPTLLLHLAPVLLARLGGRAPASTEAASYRIDDDVAAELAMPRLRIANEPADGDRGEVERPKLAARRAVVTS